MKTKSDPPPELAPLDVVPEELLELPAEPPIEPPPPPEQPKELPAEPFLRRS
jgi:hypothetical protein